MTLPEILTLFEYDTWATDRTLEVVSSVPERSYLEDLKSSHGGIHGTLVHIYSSNMIWLGRWKGLAPSRHIGSSEIPSLESLKTCWKKYQADLQAHLRDLNESALLAPLSFRDLKGTPHSYPLFQLMQYLINHSSYHRGQIVTMLRQIGIKPVATDLIVFIAERKGF